MSPGQATQTCAADTWMWNLQAERSPRRASGQLSVPRRALSNEGTPGRRAGRKQGNLSGGERFYVNFAMPSPTASSSPPIVGERDPRSAILEIPVIICAKRLSAASWERLQPRQA